MPVAPRDLGVLFLVCEEGDGFYVRIDAETLLGTQDLLDDLGLDFSQLADSLLYLLELLL
jgi:hypothetical protein